MTRAFGDIAFDHVRRVLWRPGHEAGVQVLRPRQSKVLAVLMSAQGSVVERATMLSHLFGPSYATMRGAHVTVRVQMHAVRRALAAAGSGVRVVTLYGVGWRLSGAEPTEMRLFTPQEAVLVDGFIAAHRAGTAPQRATG